MRTTLLVTRPIEDAHRTAAQLEALDITPVIAPMLEARPIDNDPPDLDGIVATAATSANAIRFLAATRLHMPLLDRPLYAVGDQTAREARAAGFSDVFSAGGTLADLASLVVSAQPNGTVLYPAAKHQSGDLAGLLAGHDIRVRTHILYEMVPAERFPRGVLEQLVNEEIAGALFYSRRTAAAFAALCNGHDFAPLKTKLSCLCMAENCAQPLLEHHFLRIALADHPDGRAMIQLAMSFARGQIKA